MKKYITPSLEIAELEVKDVITASKTGITDNGNGSITVGDDTISGKEGTFTGIFGDL